MRKPKQIEHTPKLQANLDKFADLLGIAADPDQSGKNPECELEAGSVACLNAAGLMCNVCGWWTHHITEHELPAVTP